MPPPGKKLAEILQASRPRSAAPADPDALAPPPFLSPLEALADVYVKARGRMTLKIRGLLTSPDLSDGLGLLRRLREEPGKLPMAEARLRGDLYNLLHGEPGPLLLGLADDRLLHPWQLVATGWDVWSNEDPKGVSLFWEGEAEDERQQAVDVLQELLFAQGEVTLATRFGERQDRVTFDGKAFYRPRS